MGNFPTGVMSPIEVVRAYQRLSWSAFATEKVTSRAKHEVCYEIPSEVRGVADY